MNPKIPHRKSRKSAKKRMLMIVNPYATTVSDRLKNLVVYALQGRFEVETVATKAQNHATEIGREVRDHGYDVVVAFGGDGTLNEVANGLAGTDVPVSVLPGGSTNVVCRTLGIPNDVVDATEHLLALADDWQPRKIDLGRADERHFVFSCGVGIDATVVKRVDAHPRLKSKAGPYYYTWAAISSFYRNYMRNPVRLRVETDAGDPVEGVTALAQNSDPFTYFPPPDPRLRGGRDRRRHPLGRRARACHPARHALADPAPVQREPARRPPSPHRALRRRHRGERRLDLERRGWRPPAPSRSRSTATTSARKPGSSCAPSPAR